jgi:L-ribulose-5-phosphate 4-epimerase
MDQEQPGARQRSRPDGGILEGEVPPIDKAVIDMHTAMYADHREAGCVIHTHSPYATAFAVARRRIECWFEALAMFGLAGRQHAGSSGGPRGNPAGVP